MKYSGKREHGVQHIVHPCKVEYSESDRRKSGDDIEKGCGNAEKGVRDDEDISVPYMTSKKYAYPGSGKLIERIG